jgi:hypothetical protein
LQLFVTCVTIRFDKLIAALQWHAAVSHQLTSCQQRVHVMCSANGGAPARQGAPGLAADILDFLQGAVSNERLNSLRKHLAFLQLDRFEAHGRHEAPAVEYTPQCRTVRWRKPGDDPGAQVCLICSLARALHMSCDSFPVAICMPGVRLLGKGWGCAQVCARSGARSLKVSEAYQFAFFATTWKLQAAKAISLVLNACSQHCKSAKGCAGR